VKKLYSISLIVLFFVTSCNNKNILKIEQFKILPLPNKVETLEGSFLLDKNTSFSFDDKNTNLEEIRNYFTDYLKTYYQLEPGKDNKANNIAVHFLLSPEIQEDEAYQLNINQEGITISGKTPTGIFYGIQSLIQMLPPVNENCK